MALIFYNVSGEGMGHAIRSQVVIRHLLSKGHKIAIFSYERAFKHLKEVFEKEKNVLEVVEITGINFVYEHNEFKIGKTIISESKKLRKFFFSNISIYTDRILKYSPNLVISDFEPISMAVARLLGIPTMCIDNQGLLYKCRIHKKYSDKLSLKAIELLKSFDGDYNFITFFVKRPLKKKYKENTSIIGPILRKEIISTKKEKEDFVLVYQTSTSNDLLFEVLKKSDEKYVVYGFNKEEKDNNLIFMKPGKNFARDLGACKAIITNGGLTLVTEAIYLGKPIYSIPVKNQIEQEVNGHYISKSGYGLTSEEINYHDLVIFLDNLKKYSRKLKKFDLKVNDFTSLDEKIKYFSETWTLPKRTQLLIKLQTIKEKVFSRHSRRKKKLERIREKRLKNKL
ncbi:hypothetical protein JXC34_03905 [Candidatus Woesearchaeota archaeon]|nr:hypothetical protein [Candidatus Woesearchaeota archaeon]